MLIHHLLNGFICYIHNLNMLRLVLLFFLFDRFIFSSSTDSPVVTTPLGDVKGTLHVSRNGFNFYTFTAIPFAEAPIGELRFKPPVPRKPWSGVLNATSVGPMCPFLDAKETDCLHLTVSTRMDYDEKSNRPVLVYFDRGNFEYGSPMVELDFGPHLLMDHDMVVVICNYRASIVGFFSTGDKYAPGNNGLKDQVEALKWVKNNIKFFGGDPNKVTICGDEAGAVSVGLHLLSPMSRGLFHRAMMLSGSPLNFWAIDKNPMKIAKKTASVLGCPTDSSEIMVECMTKARFEDKLRPYVMSEWNGEGRSHSPVVEIENEGQERFLVKDPIVSIREGDIADVPIFIGSDTFEGFRAPKILAQEDWTDDLSQNWTRILPIILGYEQNDAISNKLREFYFGSLDRPIKSKDNLTNLFGDARTVYGVIEFTKLISQKITKPVYLYQFNYTGKSDFRQAITYYIFRHKYYQPNFTSDSTEGQFVTKMTTLWNNFMETGNPTPKASAELNHFIWEPYTEKNPKYLSINGTLKMENGIYFPERIEFWEKFFPVLEKS